MATPLFMPPPGNFNMGPGGLDDLLKSLSPTPEIMEPIDVASLGEADDYKRNLVGCIRKVWDHESSANYDRWDKISRAWEQINNNWTDAKDPDQADLRLPEGLMLDKQALGILFAMFEQSPNWWEVSTQNPKKQVFINLVKDLVNDQLNNSRCNWWDIVEEGMESMIVTGHVNTLVAVKYGNTMQLGQGAPKGEDAETAEGSQKLFNLFQPAPEGSDKPFVRNEMLPILHFRNIPTEYCNKDTSGENLYHVWTLDLPVGVVFMQAEKLGYDKEALKRAKAHGYSVNTQPSMVTAARMNRPMALDGASQKLIRLTFHEGDLIDLDTGALVHSKKYTIMANDSEIIYGPTDIPWWDCEPTIVDAPFLSQAHETYGKGLISENADTLMMTHVLNNQMVDYLNEAFGAAFEYDKDKLTTEAQRTNLKIYPRALIPVENDSGQPVFRRIPLGEVNNSAWQVAQALESRKQNVTGTSQMGGAPRGRGRITSGEYNAREAQASNLWKLVFRNIQSKWLSPLLRLGFLRILQFYPQQLWSAYVMMKADQLLSADPSMSPEQKMAWQAAYEECAGWTAEKRYAELGSDYEFKVKVFSALMERQGRVEKGAFLLRNIPPDLYSQINMQEWLRQMVTDLGYDAEKILNKAAMPPPSATGPGGPSSPFQGEDEEEVPDVTGGLMSGLPNLSPKPMSGGPFPGGPSGQIPGSVSPPPGM